MEIQTNVNKNEIFRIYIISIRRLLLRCRCETAKEKQTVRDRKSLSLSLCV